MAPVRKFYNLNFTFQHNIGSADAYQMMINAEDVDPASSAAGPNDEVGSHFLASTTTVPAASTGPVKHQCPVCKNEVMASFMERHLSVMHVLSKGEKANILLGLGIQPSATPTGPAGKSDSSIKKAQCPKCSNLVVTKYIERHLQIIHKMGQDEIKGIVDSLGIETTS